MRGRIVIAGIWWMMIVMTLLITGCSQSDPGRSQAVARPGHSSILQDGIRVRRDAARNRIWLLGIEDVRVYDAGTERLIRRMALPNWSVARFVCDPDMVLDASGSAVISSNVEARLWRVDADTFAVSEHKITLLGRENWEVGFAALAPIGNGKLLALTSVAGSFWSVDFDKGTAQMAAPTATLSNLCGLAARRSAQPTAGLDTFTSFVPAAGSDYATGSAVTGMLLAARRTH